MTNVLGISAFYHDSAAAVVQDGEIVAAAQEERFTRKKHDPSFPRNAVNFSLDCSGLSVSDLDAIVFYDKPLLKFERLLETYYGFAPSGIRSFVTAVPVWLREKMFLKKLIYDEITGIGPVDRKRVKLLFPEHHLSHAASAFYPSPFEEAVILTIDGVGEWATASICHGRKNRIKILKELRFPHSLGLLYSAFTYWLGFKVNSGEYKLMGLAPYGNPDSQQVSNYRDSIKKYLIDIKDDGSLWLNQGYFNYATGLTMVKEKAWEKIFGFARRKPESEIEQHHCDLALAIQRISEEVIVKMAYEAKRLTGVGYLCMAGGVALNCVANSRLLKEGLFEDVWIQPAAGDAGGALGAALAGYHIHFNRERNIHLSADGMQGAFLGPEFSDKEIKYMAMKYKAEYEYFEDFDALTGRVALYLAEGGAIGWFQGRMEFGPRALGNRSIIADPRNPEMQRRLNLKIKYRESFRPFAPAVRAEECREYFELEGFSPYMLLTGDIRKEIRRHLPVKFNELPLREKLYHMRSDIPAVTHIDFSARVQTVHKETNLCFYELLSAFKRKTGCGVLVNTSFNVRGEPIVCTPEDAYRCFMRTGMDYLVIGDFLFDKRRQPAWKEKDNWKEEFTLD